MKEIISLIPEKLTYVVRDLANKIKGLLLGSSSPEKNPDLLLSTYLSTQLGVAFQALIKWMHENHNDVNIQILIDRLNLVFNDTNHSLLKEVITEATEDPTELVNLSFVDAIDNRDVSIIISSKIKRALTVALAKSLKDFNPSPYAQYPSEDKILELLLKAKSSIPDVNLHLYALQLENFPEN